MENEYIFYGDGIYIEVYKVVEKDTERFEVKWVGKMNPLYSDIIVNTFSSSLSLHLWTLQTPTEYYGY